MALYDMPRAQHGGLSITGWIAGLVNAIVRWNDIRATRKALGALTDRELDDIGLTRGDIETVSHR